ncbi:hypothetical protein [Desulfitobacterium hafniense]|uniref:hypothetical protein n=1 Tax=Desulfitobacterium hafniense TaxID=49338 RepID=UPI000360354B|nr:hypothetical protein [Desulfitobacterium hafniense]
MSKEQNPKPVATSRNDDSGPLKMKLPENYIICKGFLYKGSMPVTLVTAGIVEAAAQGFLQVDDAQEYETR